MVNPQSGPDLCAVRFHGLDADTEYERPTFFLKYLAMLLENSVIYPSKTFAADPHDFTVKYAWVGSLLALHEPPTSRVGTISNLSDSETIIEVIWVSQGKMIIRIK